MTQARAALGLEAVQRRLSLYLRALWGRPFEVAADAAPLPSIRSGRIELPAAWNDAGLSALPRYRAAAAHAAAHLIFGEVALVDNDLKQRQRALIALMEDARVESLAMRAFPGLHRLWMPFHQASFVDGCGFDALLARLARAIIDSGYTDTDHWVCKGVALYQAKVHENADSETARLVGMQLANDLGQLRIPMNEAAPPCVAAYRDDNRHLWVREQPLAVSADAECQPIVSGRHSAHLIESAGGKSLPFAMERPPLIAPAGWSIRTVEGDAALEFSASDPAAASGQYRYPEWDYRIGLSRHGWTTVHERAVPVHRPGLAAGPLARFAHLRGALERVVTALGQQGRAHLRHQYEGEDVDLNAAVGAAVELRSRDVPELRVYTRQRLRRRQDVTMLLLLDLSESMNDRLPRSHGSVLELTRDATLLLAVVLARLGERFAVHGFSSNGRHEVAYARFKEFDQSCDAGALDRIAGMQAEQSTRLGAALRHAGITLARQPGDRKLLLVLTDGQPSDIDVHDAEYLTEDARAAVHALRVGGVHSFCLSLDARSDVYAARIFGPAHYEIVDHIERLPEKLPRLVLTLTRRP